MVGHVDAPHSGLWNRDVLLLDDTGRLPAEDSYSGLDCHKESLALAQKVFWYQQKRPLVMHQFAVAYPALARSLCIFLKFSYAE